jgi:type IV secretory pathway VirB3-like protein
MRVNSALIIKMARVLSSIPIKAITLEIFLMINLMVMDSYNMNQNILLEISKMVACRATAFGKTKKVKNMLEDGNLTRLMAMEFM